MLNDPIGLEAWANVVHASSMDQQALSDMIYQDNVAPPTQFPFPSHLVMSSLVPDGVCTTYQGPILDPLISSPSE